MSENNQNKSSQNEQQKILVSAILLNLFLVGLKMVAGYLSNSKALIADAIHSGSDVITSVGVLLGLSYAKKPRDQEHPYGHEKIETITAFLLSLVLVSVGLNMGVQSFRAIMNPEPVTVGVLALFSAAISIVIKELQFQMTIRVGERTHSNAMKADAWHHRSDALSSVATLIGLIGAAFGIVVLDAIMGVVVSAIVAKVGWDIFKESFHGLIDVAIDEKELEVLKEKIMKLEAVYHINDLRTRLHGSVVFVEVRVCVNPHMDIQRGHQVTEQIEEIVAGQLNQVEDVIVHLDPCLPPAGKGRCSKNCNLPIE